MRAYLVRHSVPNYEPDDDGAIPTDPPLTKEGRDIAKAVAQWMLENDEVPNSIMASPSLRAQETAEILRDELGLPKVQTVVSMGPEMSIRAVVQEIGQDEDATRVAIVSHHESISHGLSQLNGEPQPHEDMFAQGELRILKIKRKDGTWKEKKRVLPSDLGAFDRY
jgi:phosphohistidine phosphatase